MFLAPVAPKPQGHTAYQWQQSCTDWERWHFGRLPHGLRGHALRRHEWLNVKSGEAAASTWLRQFVPATPLPLDATDADLRERAASYAKGAEVWARSIEQAMQAAELQAWIESYCNERGVSPPAANDLRGLLARVSCPKWWLRRLRSTVARECEKLAVNLGVVHKHKQAYVSDMTVARINERDKRNQQLLERLEATNELGDSFTVAELSARSVSNPAIRRAELMTRARGYEELADAMGYEAMFYTLTAPSKYHARRHDGKPNRKWAGEYAKAAHAYLVGLWANIRKEFNRKGLRPFGFRVAEPHHDGTAHWHMLLFMAPEWVGNFDYEARLNKDICTGVTGIIGRHAYMVDGNEKGAKEHRYEAKRIDKSKGSATGYIAKYITKNVDGEHMQGLESDESGLDAKSSAKRVQSWAKVWGIRQFQQIGGAPVTVWREFRKLRELTPAQASLFGEAWGAADSGNWKRYQELNGGAVCKRADRPFSLVREEVEEGGRYNEPVQRIKGVQGFLERLETYRDGIVFNRQRKVIFEGELKTRLHEWRVQMGGGSRIGAAERTRTCVNNYRSLIERGQDGRGGKGINERAIAQSAPECGAKGGRFYGSGGSAGRFDAVGGAPRGTGAANQ